MVGPYYAKGYGCIGAYLDAPISGFSEGRTSCLEHCITGCWRCCPRSPWLRRRCFGQLSHGLSSYTIDADSGKLTKLKEYPMGKNPNWVEIVDLP